MLRRLTQATRSRALRGPWLELVLAVCAAIAFAGSSLRGRSLMIVIPIFFLLLTGSLLTGFKPWAAVGFIWVGLALAALTLPWYSLFALAACLLSLFSLSSRGMVRRAIAALAAYMILWVVATVRLTPPATWPLLTVLTLVANLAGATVGLTFRAVRLETDALLKRTLRQQRLEIASELHDYVTHDLSLMVLRAEQAALTDGEDPDLQFVATTARRCNANTRKLMGLLMTVEPETHRAETSLGKALSSAEARLIAHHFPVTIMSDDDPASLPRATQSTLVKVVDEVTNNIIHHGDPSKAVTIIYSSEEDFAILAILNTPLPHSQSGYGVGVPAMRQRVEAFSGTFFSDRQGDQWITRVELPLTNAGKIVEGAPRGSQ